ncbi:N-carbamoyl-L-amino acid amidohydrolase [Carnobacterium sp. AT7]|nr:N-carbamoyl-L-amino acid amidohydrolase [Carnobacterium sp. AT7]
MDYKKIDTSIFVRIDKDEEILDKIQEICKK